MTEIAFPFDAGPGAVVGETQWQQMARHFLATGVLTGVDNQLAVTAPGTGLTVTLATGAAWLRGFHYRNTAPKALAVAAANPTNPRIDTVVIRLDRAADTVTAAVLTGTAAASPAAPPLTQTDDLFELPIANIAVPAAAGVVAAGGVTDRRAFTGAFDSAAYEAKVSRAAAVAGQVPVLQADGSLSFGVPGGGIAASLVDAKGDLLVASAADTITRLAVGVPGEVLTSDPAQALGQKWAKPFGIATGSYVGNATARSIVVGMHVRILIVTEPTGDYMYLFTPNGGAPSGRRFAASSVSGVQLATLTTTGFDLVASSSSLHPNISGLTYTYTALGF